MRSTVALLVAVGCSFQHGRPIDSDDAMDARTDAAGDRLDARIDGPADARTCPALPGCMVFQCATTTSCYYYCAAKTSWTSAQSACATVQNGCLVTINDQAEHECIIANVTPMFVNFPWIGLRQGPTATEPAGGWSFECGASSFAASWAASEPNNVGDEDCAGMAEGGWFDTECTENGRYVCEVP